MKKFLKRINAKQAGFTLIELLVVIAIIGILAAIIVPNVSKYISGGSEAAAKAEGQIVQNAALAAMADAKLGSVPNWKANDTAATTDNANFGRGIVSPLNVENPVNTVIQKNGVNVSVQSYMTGSSTVKAKYVICQDGNVKQVPDSYVP